MNNSKNRLGISFFALLARPDASINGLIFLVLVFRELFKDGVFIILKIKIHHTS